MRKNFTKTIVSLALAATMLFSSNTTAFAANNEYQGSADDSKSVEITATISSIYSVSLPAQIDLAYAELADVYVGDADEISTKAEGYFGDIIFGAAGKIGANESVFVEPQFPCVMTGTSGATVQLKKILDSNKTEPKTSWNKAEIGTCTYDGVSLSNCNYAYNNGLKVGFLTSDLSTFENYTGTLVFNFGIRSN